MSDICIPFFGRCNLRNPTPPGSVPRYDAPENPYFSDCEDLWNDNLCANDKCWRMPVEAGDTISIQNPIRTDVDVYVQTLNGAIIEYYPLGPGETVTMNLPDSGCFTLKFDNHRSEACLGWDYEAVSNCSRPTVKIRGLYKDGEKDCFGFVYPFDNSIRLYGTLVEGKASNIEKTIYGTHIKKRKVTSYYTLYINDMLPPVIHRVLANQILSANQIEVEFDGKAHIFETEESFNLQSEDLKNKMFYYGKSIKLIHVCEVPGKC